MNYKELVSSEPLYQRVVRLWREWKVWGYKNREQHVSVDRIVNGFKGEGVPMTRERLEGMFEDIKGAELESGNEERLPRGLSPITLGETMDVSTWEDSKKKKKKKPRRKSARKAAKEGPELDIIDTDNKLNG